MARVLRRPAVAVVVAVAEWDLVPPLVPQLEQVVWVRLWVELDQVAAAAVELKVVVGLEAVQALQQHLPVVVVVELALREGTRLAQVDLHQAAVVVVAAIIH